MTRRMVMQTGRHHIPTLAALVLLGACTPGTGTGAIGEAPLPANSSTTTAAAGAAPVTGVALGFNNAEQGVIAPDGTPLLVVVKDGAAAVVRGTGSETVRAGGSGRVTTPAIATGDTRVVVAWAEAKEGGVGPVKAAVSVDSGRTFAPEQVLGTGGGPSLASSGDTIAAVWHTGAEGGRDGDVVLALQPAGTDTWQPAEAVDDSPAAPVWASVDVRGSTATVAWRDDRDGAYSVWTRTSADLGATWAPEVHAVTASSGDPDVCIDEAATVWLGYHGRGRIDLTRSTDGGATFAPAVNVGDGWFAHVSCDTAVVALAWEETTAPPKAPEADKAAGWATYTPEMVPITRGSQGGPDAAGATVVPATGGGLALVWCDADAGALTGTLQRVTIPG